MQGTRRPDGIIVSVPTLEDIAWPVRTERLLIRPATVNDVESTWSFRRLPEVTEWMTIAPKSIEDYRKHFEQPDRLPRTLIMENDGHVVGDLMIRIEDAWVQAEVADQGKGAQAEIGWCIDPAYGGRGLATEATHELMRICFEDLGLHRVIALCFADNVASWRLMERVGMRRETHTIRDSLHRSLGWLDGYGYGLLKDEWESRRSV
jgi:RimJ/RimL family protein N-acetyltransferase